MRHSGLKKKIFNNFNTKLAVKIETQKLAATYTLV